MRLKLSLKKILSVIATSALIFNSLAPSMIVMAQEITPTPTPTETAAPTPDATVTPTDTVTPAPTDIASPTPTNNSITQSTNNPISTTTPTDTPTPEATITPTTESSATPVATPVVTTDQADYQPGQIATITGQFFQALQNLVVKIFGGSTTDGTYTESNFNVVADALGSFSLKYTLDSISRPLYTTQVFDATGTQLAQTTFTDPNPSANLDQCANDPAPSPNTDGCNSNANQWVNGNLGASKSNYLEGDSIPYRMIFGSLSLASHKVTIEWDTTKSGTHAIDYLTTFNRTVANADPCLGVSGCSSSTPFAIPADPQVTGAGVTPIAGNFTLYGGTITSVSAYSYADGTGFAGDKSARITITFTATQANPVLAWGGHIATRHDWGIGNSAVAIPGSPYHTRLIDLDGSGGNQDRSLSAEAVVFPGSITIIKDATPNGPTSFSFTGSPSPLTNFTLVDDGTSANTQLFGTITNFTTYTVNETPIPAGWGFDSSSCVVTSPNGGSFSTSTTSTSIVMKEGENWTCTYLDSLRTGTLTVIKHVVNDNGGTAVAGDFTLHVRSGITDVSGSPAIGEESPGRDYTLTGGAYVVSEDTPPTGYTRTGFSGDCDSSGNIAVVAGATKTCTITNDDNAPQLHLRKTVTNDNGGAAAATDWTLTATGTGGSPTNLSGSTPVDSGVGFQADTYTLGETGPTGYTPGSWSCIGDVTNSGTSITLGIGQSATCTINNNDTPAHLIVIKHVINDNGGTASASAFTTTITGVTTANPTAAGAESPGIDNTLTSVGSYSVDEGAYVGYDKTLSSDCSGTIALGETKTCTITNDDIAPSLTLDKIVVNDNGGTAKESAWTLTATGATTLSGPGATGNTDVVSDGTFSAGTYTLSESTGPSGYSPSDWSCVKNGGQPVTGTSITLGLGDTATCTITNDDIQPKLTLVKTVENNYGGTLQVSDFPLFVDQTGVTSGVTNGFDAGTYIASETEQYGYSPSEWGGDCAADGSITLAVGDNKTCTITNDDIAPKLKLVKTVVNDNGGTAVVSDFPLFIDGTPAVSGTSYTETANVELTATETNKTGYAPSVWGGDCAADGTITLLPGDDKTCTITNDDIAPKLHLRKIVTNDSGGTATVADFTLTADGAGTNDLSGTSPVDSGAGLLADTFALSETNVTGYSASAWDCVGGTQNGSNITVGIGGEATCTITNDDISPTLTVNKVLVPSTDSGLFDLKIDSSVDATDVRDGGTTGAIDVNAGSHSVSEVAGTNTSLNDYTSVISGDCAADGTVSLALAENKTCTITNTRKGSLTIIKDAKPNDLTNFSFSGTLGTFTLDDDAGVSGEDNTFSNTATFSGIVAGTDQTVTEGAEPNQFWEFGGITCVDTGTTTPYTGITVVGQSVTVHIEPGANVTCTFTNNKLGPTRTLGFWQTHTAYTSSMFATYFPIGMPIGTTPHKGDITNTESVGQSELFGAYYASISMKSTGKGKTAQRGAIDQGRMILLQQLVTAKLNCAVFGCSSTIEGYITAADAAYTASDLVGMRLYTTYLGSYNNSGDTLTIGPAGSATPKTSSSWADIPFWDAP